MDPPRFSKILKPSIFIHFLYLLLAYSHLVPLAASDNETKALQIKFNVLSDITDMLRPAGFPIHMDSGGTATAFGKSNAAPNARLTPFAIGVDFQKWEKILEARGDEFMSAPSKADFETKVNDAFRELGVSHLDLESMSKKSSAQNVANHSSAVRKSDAANKLEPSHSSQPITLTFYNHRKTGGLKISDFEESYDRQCIEKLIEEAKKHSEELIIDLRDNSGGLIQQLDHLKSLLHPGEPGTVSIFSVDYQRLSAQLVAQGKPVDFQNIYRTAYAEAKQKLSKDSKKPHFDQPISVIVNENSASCAEDLAICLREVRNSQIYGYQSSGALVATIPVQLKENFRLHVPIAAVISSLGTNVEGEGIKPDHPAKPGEDPLMTAIAHHTEFLAGKIKEAGLPPRCPGNQTPQPTITLNCSDIDGAEQHKNTEAQI